MTRRQPPHQSLMDSIPGVASTRRPAPAPVDQWNPPVSGEMDMQIVRDGTWYHEGDPINRKALVQLFASILRRDADERYYLVTPTERWAIQVDDAPFVATQLKVEGEGERQKLTFTTNLEDTVAVGAEHPIRIELDPATQEPSPYVLARANLEALIGRNVFYQMVELAVEREYQGNTCLGVWSDDMFFPIDGNHV